MTPKRLTGETGVMFPDKTDELCLTVSYPGTTWQGVCSVAKPTKPLLKGGLRPPLADFTCLTMLFF